MENNEAVDALTAPIEQVREMPHGVTAPPPPANEVVAPAAPEPDEEDEGDSQGVTYGGGGPVPVPPLESARAETDEQEAAKQAPDNNGVSCECSRWQSVNPATGKVEEEAACERITKNPNSRFAPGHDARFKGMLIRAGERGWKMWEIGSSEPLVRPTSVAVRVSQRMARQVEEGIARRRGR
jgi:hypothetical protein